MLREKQQQEKKQTQQKKPQQNSPTKEDTSLHPTASTALTVPLLEAVLPDFYLVLGLKCSEKTLLQSQ